MNTIVSKLESFTSETAQVDQAAVKPLPNSRKIYISGSSSAIRVPMREIIQTDTVTRTGAEKNPSIYVYDTSGPYTDPNIAIDIRDGLYPLREQWIEARGDTELLSGLTSAYSRERSNNPKLSELRFNLKRASRKAKSRSNVTQMHYARQGIITPEKIGRAHV